MAEESSEIERSSGGVLVRPDDDGEGRKVCLIQMPTRSGNPSWRLPKGRIESDENSEEAAIRETEEETGCLGEILTELDGITYWYTRRDESGEKIRVRKEVDFYLMDYREGSIEAHDEEVDEIEWFTFAEALDIISYDAERRVLEEAVHAWDAYHYDPRG